MRRLRDSCGFRLGQHGAYLTSGRKRGLLLPQVAEGRDWTREEFLGALARKAGLAADAWSHPETRLYAFRAQIFSRLAPALES